MRRASLTAERRLVLFVGAVVFLDTMFYAAIAPLLPELAHQFKLSKLSAGVMTASYPAGTLIASIPGGLLAVRRGPRAAVYAGLTLLAGSTLAFGLLQSATLLDVARFVEGVGGAYSWAGGIAWIVAQARPERRGSLMGAALGAAIGGALFGPVVGVVASAIGRGPAFSAVVAGSVALIVVARRLPAPPAGSDQGIRQFGAALRDRRLLAGMWLMALPALASGTLSVLGPLRLHRLGADAVGIGATYLAATAIEATISPLIGAWSDRRGRLLPLRSGLAAAGAVLICFTLPSAPVLLAVVIVAIIAALGLFWAPAMAMVSDTAEHLGLDQGLAAALMNLAWAGGQIVGSGAGGAVAKAFGDAVPVGFTVALCLVTLLATIRPRAPVAA